MHSRPLKRASLATVALATTVAVVLPVSADAPISGPDRQYDPFVQSETTITDHFTKLKWSRPKSGVDYPEMTLSAAETFCAGLSASRLPTVKELLTLVDEEPHAEYVGLRNVPRYIDQRAFLRTPATSFWTSSKPPDGNGTYTVDFTTGLVARATGSSTPGAVRCVR